MVARFDQIRGLSPGGQLTRIHGDLHLGQLLRVEPAGSILDFEGEPDRTPAQRRELSRRSRCRRDASIVRLRGRGRDHRAHRAGQRRGEGLYGLRRGVGGRESRRVLELVPRDHRLHADAAAPGPALVLRRAFEVQKAVYEIGYELGHRPGGCRSHSASCSAASTHDGPGSEPDRPRVRGRADARRPSPRPARDLRDPAPWAM